MSKLFLFTGTFPFGYRESFLEQEILYLKECFDTVVLIPLGGEGSVQRSIPEKVIVDNSLHGKRSVKVICGVLNIWRVFPSYFIDFFKKKVFSDKKVLKRWIKSSILTSYYLQSRSIKDIKKSASSNDVLYYYWGVDFNLIAPFLKINCVQVSRFHGDWDLWYDGGKSEAYSPCRNELFRVLDCAVTISNKGNKFLRLCHPGVNVQTFRLGTLDYGEARKSEDGFFRILSCSAVYPLKRVDLIYRCVKRFAMKRHNVIWTHIGDGSSFNDICQLCTSEESINFQVRLMGRMPHNEVLKYYKDNEVDVFVNMSTNEGIPVSIMEAISFNVPVLATNVGATEEIVSTATGVLVDANPTEESVIRGFEYLESTHLNPKLFWRINYNAETNYRNFAHYIKSLADE